MPQHTRTRTPFWISPIVVGALALAAASVVAAQTTAPPPPEFQKVSTLVELPDFVPGLGVLYVNPSSLPAGPFLGYDRDGRLVNTTYMIPLAAMNDHTAFNELDVAAAPVDHVDVYYNAGHPGLAEPHYHIVLWHVPRSAAAQLR